MPRDVAVRADLTMKWLSLESGRLAEEQRSLSAREQRIVHLIGVMMTLDTPPEEIEPRLPKPLPARIAAAMAEARSWATSQEPGQRPDTVSRRRPLSPRQQRILDIVAEVDQQHDADMSPSDIRLRLEGRGTLATTESVRKSLRTLHAQGLVQKSVDGRYRLNQAHFNAEWPPASPDTSPESATSSALTPELAGQAGAAAGSKRKRQRPA